MYRKILVCSDGSRCALAAVRAGAAIARRYNAEIIALNVFQPAYAGFAEIGAWAVAVDQEMIDCWARKEKQVVEQEIAPIFEDLTTPHRIHQEVGHPVEAILGVAKREGVDLIVVGCRGLRGFKELYLGSVSSSVLHHADCPVLIVRGDHLPDDKVEFEHILLASDASVCAQAASTAAVELAQKFATSLTVLNVCTGLSPDILPEREEVLFGDFTPEAYAARLLELVRQNVCDVAEAAGVYCDYVQRGGHPYDVIVQYAKEHNTDLIVLGSRGLGGFEQMLVGSVSNYVAHHSPCPVLVVRAPRK